MIVAEATPAPGEPRRRNARARCGHTATNRRLRRLTRPGRIDQVHSEMIGEQLRLWT